MTILFVDGFDHYATGDFPKCKWDRDAQEQDWNDNTIESTTPDTRNGYGKYLQMNASTATYLLKNLNTALSEVYMGFALYTDNLSYAHMGVRFYSPDGTVQTTVRFTTTGAMEVFRGTHTGTQLDISSDGVIVAQTWHWVEIWMKFSNTVGDFDVEVDGTNVCAGTGTDDTVNTTETTCGKIGLWSKMSTGVCYDDLYIADANNSQAFLGDSRVETVYPTGNGTSSEWAASTGSAYQCVDESGDINDDTDYISESTTNDVQLFTFTDIDDLQDNTIHAVAVNYAARRTDVEARKIKPIAYVSSTEYQGTETTPGASDYTLKQNVWQNNPNTSAAWTRSGVNGAEFGVELTG